LEVLEVPGTVGTREQIRNLPSGDAKAIEFDVRQVKHVTAAGETLTDIAGQYQVSVDRLQELNGLIDPHNLLIGQELVIFAGSDELNAQQALTGKTVHQRKVIGTSAHGHSLESFRIGDGRHDVIVVGAIHGGYEWNTALLAYRFLTYFSVYPEKIPDNVSLHLIPIANPDGVVAVTGKSGPFMAVDVSGDTTVGRLNGNGIDLNRNWGCQWSPVGWWRETSVSAGSRPFSEPETKALREYLIKIEPEVVIWLHSAAGLVIPGNCEGIYHAPSEKAALLYGGYPLGEFDAYQVTGDAADWFAQHKIASFTVELSDHQGLEFAQNLAGLTSLMAGIEALDEE
jgi:g-D-glutamyl-meso-diaminopimelate peptidase